MDLAHRQAPAPEPAAVALTELRVAIAVGMLLEIFEMEQLEGDAGPAPLGIQVCAVRDGALMRGRGRRSVDSRGQDVGAERGELSPAEAVRARARHRRADGAGADPQAPMHPAAG